MKSKFFKEANNTEHIQKKRCKMVKNRVGLLVGVFIISLLVFSAFSLARYYDPTPIEPTPIEPTPIEPTPIDPILIEPTPITPTPIEPTPIDPTDINPTPIEPTPIEPFDNFDERLLDAPAEEPVEWTAEETQQAEDIADQLGVDDSADATAADEIEMYTEKELRDIVQQQKVDNAMDEAKSLLQDINNLRQTRDTQSVKGDANEKIQEKTADLQARLGRILLDDPSNFQANYALGQIYRGQGYEETASVFYRRALMNLPTENFLEMQGLTYADNKEERAPPWILLGNEAQYYGDNIDRNEIPDRTNRARMEGDLQQERERKKNLDELERNIDNLDGVFDPDNDGASYVVGKTNNPKAYSSEMLSRAMSMSTRFSNYVAGKDVFGINKPQVNP